VEPAEEVGEEEAGERILALPPVQVQFPVAKQAWQDGMVGVGVLPLLHPRLGVVAAAVEVADTNMFVTVYQMSNRK